LLYLQNFPSVPTTPATLQGAEPYIPPKFSANFSKSTTLAQKGFLMSESNPIWQTPPAHKNELPNQASFNGQLGYSQSG